MNTTELAHDSAQIQIACKRWEEPPNAPARLPVILFHDSLGCVEMWKTFPAQLAQMLEHPVIAFDRWGYGRSSERHTPPSVTFMEEEAVLLERFLDTIRLDQVILLGHSVGGALALNAAARLRARVEAVVSISAPTFMEEKTIQGVATAKARAAQDHTVEKLARYHGSKAAWVFAAWTETWTSAEFANWSIRPFSIGVNCPVLAIQGDQDPFGSVEHARLIASTVAGPNETVILPGRGHFPHRENPTEVLNSTAQFLARHCHC